MKRKKAQLLKLNIGDSCPDDFVNVEPLRKFPYRDASIGEIRCSHYLHKIPGRERGRFMDEMWRLLAPTGKATVITPYWTSARSIMDYRFEWPPVCEQSYLYFNKGWRDQNKVNGCSCDFDFTYGYQADPETALRSVEVQADRIKHYLNSVLDLHVTLTKRG